MGEVEIRLQNINTGSFEKNTSDISGEDSAREKAETIAIPSAEEDLSPAKEDSSPGENLSPEAGDSSVESARPDDAVAGDTASDDATSVDAGPDDAVPEDAASDDAGPDDDTLVAAMEAILFAMGDAVPVDSLVQALGVSRDRVLEASDTLSERCRQPGSGVSLNWYEDSIQLSTKPELYEYLIRIASEPKKPKLTPTLLETLSIIAFRQPVTRMEVENIRGVNSDFAINRLVSFDLVQEVGRKEVPGRPLLFGTTQQFLRSFGIRSVDELPEPDSSHMEVFREEAEEEVSSKLNI